MSAGTTVVTRIAGAAVTAGEVVQQAAGGTVTDATDGTIATGQMLLGIAENGAANGENCAVTVLGHAKGVCGFGGIANGTVKFLTCDTATGTGRLIAAAADDQVVAIYLGTGAAADGEEIEVSVVPSNWVLDT